MLRITFRRLPLVVRRSKKNTNHESRVTNDEDGFSLLELIIAIGVLAIGLVGILQIFPIGLRASYRSGMITKATFLAHNKMEEVKVAGLDAIREEPPKIPLSGRDEDFDWEISIDEVDMEDLASRDDIRKVTVSVSWIERDITRTKKFITYVTR